MPYILQAVKALCCTQGQSRLKHISCSRYQKHTDYTQHLAKESQMNALTACGTELVAASLEHGEWAPLSPAGSSKPRTELLTQLQTPLLTSP